jgi:chromate reductase, NAD(P)H dehydrogenase (quinone)
MSLVLISTTNRPNSYSLAVTRKYQELLEVQKVQSEIIDLAQLPANFVQAALYEKLGEQEEFNQVAGPIGTGQKFVLIVPEYNGSFPGVLKAFIDGLNYKTSFRGKKVGLVGISSGNGGAAIAMSHLTDIFHYLGAEVMHYKPRLTNIDLHMKSGRLEHAGFSSDLARHINLMLAF